MQRLLLAHQHRQQEHQQKPEIDVATSEETDDLFHSGLHSPSIDVLGSRSASVSSTELTMRFKPGHDELDNGNDTDAAAAATTASLPHSSRQSAPSVSSSTSSLAANDLFAYDQLHYDASGGNARISPSSEVSNGNSSIIFQLAASPPHTAPRAKASIRSLAARLQSTTTTSGAAAGRACRSRL